VGSLVARVRQYAAELFDAGGIAWTFEAPAEVEALPLPAGRRRHLLLIFKEALRNAARHAQAHRVSLRLVLEDGLLCGEVRDDGRGFTPPGGEAAEAEGGYGLRGMARRAGELGGRLEAESRPGSGTRIAFRVPARRGA
jgi:signal transduction histidine kinase